jgi:predicted O-methyltransferase YrrM
LDSREEVRDLLLASVKLEDAYAVYCIIREKQPCVILEIGTFVGFSTCIMAQALKDNGKGTIYCVDPDVDYFSVTNPQSHARKMLERLGLDSFVRMHKGFFSEPREGNESGREVLGKKVTQIVPPIDLAFIDGDHATTAVLQDFMLLLPAFRDRACVIFHDAKRWPSVRRAIATVMQDKVYNQKMSYFEIEPAGVDGIGLVEIDKTRQLAKKDGIDKWTSV